MFAIIDSQKSGLSSFLMDLFTAYYVALYSATSSALVVENKKAKLEIEIDTSICPVMDYFEIFLKRMKMCRNAATSLGLTFELFINQTQLL